MRGNPKQPTNVPACMRSAVRVGRRGGGRASGAGHLAARGHGGGRNRDRLPTAGHRVARTPDAECARRDRDHAERSASAGAGCDRGRVRHADRSCRAHCRAHRTQPGVRTLPLGRRRRRRRSSKSASRRHSPICRRSEVPLATVLISLRQQTEKPPEVALDDTPPQHLCQCAAREPRRLRRRAGARADAGTTLSFVVNTNWDVFADSASKRWYLLNNGVWLAALEADRAVGTRRPSCRLRSRRCRTTRNFAAVKKQVPGRTVAAKDAPTIFVSTVPAEIIVTNGPPKFAADPGHVAAVRRQHGRRRCSATPPADACTSSCPAAGFRRRHARGPWTFATTSLPAGLRAHSRQRPARIRAGVGARNARRRRKR